MTRPIDSNVALAAVRSLPDNLPNLTVSFFYFYIYDWENPYRFIPRLDSVLAEKAIVVEIAPLNPDDHGIAYKELPQLSAKKKLHLLESGSDASQIFETTGI